MKYPIEKLPNKILEQIKLELNEAKERPWEAIFDFTKQLVVFFIIASVLLVSEQEITYCEWRQPGFENVVMYGKMRDVFTELNEDMKVCIGEENETFYLNDPEEFRLKCRGYIVTCDYDFDSAWIDLQETFNAIR